MDVSLFKTLVRASEKKIVLLVLDGLGGLPMRLEGPTELEAAYIPNMDFLAGRSVCGLHEPVGAGITPGSGPGHLALFGYNPLRYVVGRGVLAALGINFSLRPDDVAARGNFCTITGDGIVVDRRAGRLNSLKNAQLCARLESIQLPETKLFVKTVKEHRFLLVLRGDGLRAAITDTDPQETGKKLLSPQAMDAASEKAAHLVELFLNQARNLLTGQYPANMVLLRGFSQLPMIPSLEETFGIRGIAIAGYPMYRGVATLLGMDIANTGDTIGEEVAALRDQWGNYDFYFIHVKATDSAGEDGDFDRKVAAIEEVDRHIPDILELGPDVLIITGDHSTPASLRAHSWHPVPVLLYADTCRPDKVHRFDEQSCREGSLGPRMPAVDLMPLALAHAERLKKFGA